MENIIEIQKINHDCPVCDRVHEVEQITRIVSSNIKNDEVEHEETILRCPEHDEEWYHGKMLDDALLKAKNAYRIKHGLLTSDEIKEIRKKYGLTQKELSNLIGAGNITVSRYETSHIQDEIYDTALKNVKANPNFALEALKKHEILFAEERFKTLYTAFKKIIKTEGLTELKKQEIERRYVEYDTECDANGYKMLDLNKTSDVMAYFTYHVNRLYKVKLMKLLWYADVVFYNKYRRSMTGLVYQHKPLGALPIGHNEIVYLPTVTALEEETESGTSYRFLPLNPPVSPIFSLEEQEVLHRVATKFKDFTSREIIDYMHNEDVYKNTSDGEVILYSQADTLIDF